MQNLMCETYFGRVGHMPGEKNHLSHSTWLKTPAETYNMKYEY